MEDKTNKKLSELRKEMDEKLVRWWKKWRKVPKKRTLSVPNRTKSRTNYIKKRNNKCTTQNDDETNTYETDNQENEIQDYFFEPSETIELRINLHSNFRRRWHCKSIWSPYRRGLSHCDRRYWTTSLSGFKQHSNLTKGTPDCWTNKFFLRPRKPNSTSYLKFCKS